MSDLHFIVVTGLSGAGRSTVLRALEDQGFFCVDNLPPPLIPGLVELVESGGLRQIGLGIDGRTGVFLDGAAGFLQQLAGSGHQVEVLFIEAQDMELVRRFSETRRVHPLAPAGDVPAAIAKERQRLAPLRAFADLIIDTTGLSLHDLRRRVFAIVQEKEGRPRMVTRLVSFGFKFGLPVDADMVFDLRYLPNPHFVPELRPLTGRDLPVSDFVLKSDEGQRLFAQLRDLLTDLLPRYQYEGKAYLTVAVGCTGGRHRSVAMAEALGEVLASIGDVRVEHRDTKMDTDGRS